MLDSEGRGNMEGGSKSRDFKAKNVADTLGAAEKKEATNYRRGRESGFGSNVNGKGGLTTRRSDTRRTVGAQAGIM